MMVGREGGMSILGWINVHFICAPKCGSMGLMLTKNVVKTRRAQASNLVYRGQIWKVANNILPHLDGPGLVICCFFLVVLLPPAYIILFSSFLFLDYKQYFRTVEYLNGCLEHISLLRILHARVSLYVCKAGPGYTLSYWCAHTYWNEIKNHRNKPCQCASALQAKASFVSPSSILRTNTATPESFSIVLLVPDRSLVLCSPRILPD